MSRHHTSTLKTSNSGFTLVEVLLAIMLLAMAMVTLNSSWNGSLFAYRKSEKVELITSLLKSKVSEYEIKYGESGFNSVKETEEGDFGEDFKDMKWKMESKKFAFPDISSLMVANGQNNEMLLTTIRQMTDYFSKNVKEMKLTITWQSGKKTLDYSATTYLVNYQGGLPSLTGGGP